MKKSVFVTSYLVSTFVLWFLAWLVGSLDLKMIVKMPFNVVVYMLIAYILANILTIRLCFKQSILQTEIKPGWVGLYGIAMSMIDVGFFLGLLILIGFWKG